MSSGGQRSSSSGGSAESVAAGCSLRELRPKSRQQRQSSGSDMEGLAVFTFGRGEDGQLGLGDTCDSDEPKFVDALRGVGVRQIACGSGHTVVLTADGEVHTWGRGDDGRLGKTMALICALLIRGFQARGSVGELILLFLFFFFNP